MTAMQQGCYNSAVTNPISDPAAPLAADPTREPARWDGLFGLLAAMDREIEQVYERSGATGMRSRFVLPIIRLAHEGPMTISELAASLGRTHSAISQTVAAMRREGLVASESGTDRRSQVLTLTDRAHALLPLLEAERRATNAVVADLDDEVGGGVVALTAALTQALERRSMTQRLDDRLSGLAGSGS